VFFFLCLGGEYCVACFVCVFLCVCVFAICLTLLLSSLSSLFLLLLPFFFALLGSASQLCQASNGALSEWARSRGSAPEVLTLVSNELARRTILQAQHCLEALVSTRGSGSSTLRQVSIEDFGRVTSLFGPLYVGSTAFLKNIVDVLRCNWFQGAISGPDALRLLKDKPPNSFLVR
jgi:hypothetical protein